MTRRLGNRVVRFAEAMERIALRRTTFGQFLKNETQKWGDLVRVSGATAD